MPQQIIEYNIPDLLPLSNPADLVTRFIEVSDANGNSNSVGVPQLIQQVANNQPAPDKLTRISARTYDDTDPGYVPGTATLVSELARVKATMGATAYAELSGKEYRLIADPNGSFQGYNGTDFTGQPRPASLVEIGSRADVLRGIADYNPFAASYAVGDDVKYAINGTLRLFTPKKPLAQVNGRIPAPTGLPNDVSWQEINAAGNTKLVDWLPGDYKKDDVVAYQGLIYRATTDIAYSLTAPDPTSTPDWEALGGGGVGGSIELNGITENIGGFHAGEDFLGSVQAAFTKLLITYQAPGFASFGFDDSGSRSVLAGTTFSGGPHYFYWSISNVANLAPNTIAITDVTLNTTLLANADNDGGESVNVAAFQLEPGQRKQFRISAQDVNGGTISADVILTGVVARFHGASSLAPAAAVAQLQNGQAINVATLGFNTDLGTGLPLNRDYNCEGGRYIYYLFSADFPNPSLVRAGLLDLTDYTIFPVTITDQWGIPRSYKLFSVNGMKNGTLNVNIIG